VRDDAYTAGDGVADRTDDGHSRRGTDRGAARCSFQAALSIDLRLTDASVLLGVTFCRDGLLQGAIKVCTDPVGAVDGRLRSLGTMPGCAHRPQNP
jgi:hypothetical protein